MSDGTLETTTGNIDGHWAVDDQHDEEGFLAFDDDTFYVYDDEDEVFRVTHFRGRRIRRTTHKGAKSQKGRGGRRFGR